MDPEIIFAAAATLFGQDAAKRTAIQDVYQGAAAYDQAGIDEVLRAFDSKHLIRLSLNGQTAQATLAGKTAFEDGSLVTLTLGTKFLIEQSRDAVVHLIVEGTEGESGGSGFFSAEFENCVVTAAHVVRDRTVLRIEDRQGNIISRRPNGVILGPHELDIALIRCPAPAGVRPLQIEWRPEAIEPLNEVLILGYPPFPNHHPALFHASANIHATAIDYHGKNKLVISSVTRPGCSGAPVISAGGFVVGIVEQANTLEQLNDNLTFFTATLARHASEIIISP